MEEILFQEENEQKSLTVFKDGDELVWRVEFRTPHYDTALYLQTELAFERSDCEFRIDDNNELFEKTAEFSKMHTNVFWGNERKVVINQIENIEDKLLEKGILNECYDGDLYELILHQPYTHYINGIPEDGICNYRTYKSLEDSSLLYLLNHLNTRSPLSLFWFEFKMQGYITGENIIYNLGNLLLPIKKLDIHTYIIKDKLNRYKIGRSSNLDKRMSQISSSNPNIELILVIPYNVEHKLHKEYEHKNVGGEWFNLSENDILNIKKKYID